MGLKAKYISKIKNERLYKLDVPVIGLTGGIATGKSSVTSILIDKGFHVLCADQLVKKVYAKPESFEFIKKEFPTCINGNQINFKLLRQEAFKSQENKAKIENYIYSHLPAMFIAEYNLLDSPKCLFYDVPLLFEKGLDNLVDLSVCVYTNQVVQLERLIARDNIKEDLAKNIIQNQMLIDDKKERADLSILNEGSLDDLFGEVDKFLEKTME